jgi:hypothetical protein
MDGPKTWILTGSLENFRINVERGFDEIVFYVTGVQAFGGIARVKSEMFEDRERIWPEKKSKPEIYPWRVEAEPVLILPEDGFVPAEELVTELEHVRKWPLDHWHLAFQGQLRTIGGHDASLLRDRLTSTAATKTAAGSTASA